MDFKNSLLKIFKRFFALNENDGNFSNVFAQRFLHLYFHSSNSSSFSSSLIRPFITLSIWSSANSCSFSTHSFYILSSFSIITFSFVLSANSMSHLLSREVKTKTYKWQKTDKDYF